MPAQSKPFAEVTVSDIAVSPVWEFATDEEESHDETWVRPVKTLPVDCLDSMVVGTKVLLGNGTKRWAILVNVDLDNARRTRQFLVMMIEKDGDWFELARYFDVDYARRGPMQLAAFLDMSVEDVFPISYDVSALAIGKPDVTTGRVAAEPDERLSDDERMDLIFGS